MATSDPRLDRLAERHGVFLTTAYAMPHPADDPARWRARWDLLMAVAAEVEVLADEAGATAG